jgi:hypothetical protein
MTSVRLVSEEGYTSNAISVLPSALRSASGNSVALDMSEYKEAVLFMDITSVVGINPALDVIVQRQDPLSSNWVSWDDGTDQSFSQKSAIGTFALPLSAPLGDTIRLNSTIAGDATAAVEVNFNDSDPDTITRASGSFIDDGFQEGATTISGTASNNFTYTVDTGGVSALTLTLVGSDAVVDEEEITATFTNITQSFTYSIQMERKVI